MNHILTFKIQTNFRTINIHLLPFNQKNVLQQNTAILLCLICIRWSQYKGPGLFSLAYSILKISCVLLHDLFSRFTYRASSFFESCSFILLANELYFCGHLCSFTFPLLFSSPAVSGALGNLFSVFFFFENRFLIPFRRLYLKFSIEMSLFYVSLIICTNQLSYNVFAFLCNVMFTF